MVNKEKTAKRNLIRIRKTQNPQQVDFRRLRRHRKARTEYWSFKKKPSAQVVTVKKEKAKPKKKAPKKKKEPELEVIDQEPEFEVIEEEPELEVFDDEPELEVIDEEPELKAVEEAPEKEPELEVIDDEPEPEAIDKELEDLYSYDDEIIDDEDLEE
ncbi:MAG: hypothetical protein PVI03_07640 [Candidatus Thorarchaeota archaeon]|jgi:hypothetical protein